jgi:predicted nucleic acid-binding protein
VIVFDTNVLSELIRPAPAEAVIAWARAQDPGTIFTTTICEAEIRYGVAIMPPGRKRSNLARAVEAMLYSVLAGRVLPFDRPAATEYAEWAAERRRAGKPVSIPDLQIASIARARRASAIATRNTADFADCGVAVIDPWATP